MLVEQWPCPRVGQYVQLLSGALCEVILVRKARDILRSMDDGGALRMATNAKAAYGKNWLDIYYEADVISPGGAFMTVSPHQVSAIIPNA